MLPTSAPFFIFLAAVFFLYWPAARTRLGGLSVLVFANIFFCARWHLLYAGLIPAASTIDFLIGLGLQRWRRRWLRRLLLSLSVALNLGLIASMKYVPFLLENYARWTGAPAPAWDWVFPLGLSFYAFQSLTYTIDVYRRDAKATTSYLCYLAAAPFFPTILAGPITRIASLAQQMARPQQSFVEASGGGAFFLIGLGLVKKFLIADYLANNLVNRVFDYPNLYSGAEVLAGVYGFALQLYYDFSGYTDIARGSAMLLGVRLPVNFNRPYQALSVADFWRRWHISLSNWLRDYLYFSLPGLRSKWKIFTWWNLFVTMALGGLWHGASWNFVLWGALHGVALAFERGWESWRGRREGPGSLASRLSRGFLTAQFVCFCWVFFRAPDLDAAMAVLARVASLTVSFENISAGLWLVAIVATAAHYLPAKAYQWPMERFAAAPFYAQAAALALLALAIEYIGATGAAPFIYTKF